MDINAISIRHPAIVHAAAWIRKKYTGPADSDHSSIVMEFEREFKCVFGVNEDGNLHTLTFDTAADKTFFLLRWT